jgi:glyoxylase-like metal-dependent hydrolase (beta-lactamase superfamily II)
VNDNGATWTVSYVVFDEPTGHCVIIDPVLDYDPKSGRTRTTSANKLIAFIEEKNLTTEWILETHAHADHLTAAHYLKKRLGGKTAIGKEIPIVQETFRKIFNLETDFTPDGKQFDHLFADNEVFSVGKLNVKVLSTPGHTPADLSYQVEEAIFVGDTLFMPDVGTARADFPGGSARRLFRSIRKILDYPADTRLSCAMIIRRKAAPLNGKRVWGNSAQIIYMCATALMKTGSSRCATRATAPSKCPRCCCRRSR